VIVVHLRIRSDQRERVIRPGAAVPIEVVVMLQSFWRHYRERKCYIDLYNKRKWTLHKEPVNRISNHVCTRS